MIFYGIRIVESDDAITIDQRPYAVGPASCTSGPWQYGTKFEASLVSALKTTPAEWKLLAKEFGFEFRELLGRFHQLSTWTRPNLTPGTIRMSMYQNAPARIHFSVLRGMLTFLARFPARGLTYPKRQCDKATKKLLHGPVTLVNPLEIFMSDQIESPIEMNYTPVDKSIFHLSRAPPIEAAAIRITAPPPTEAECDASYGSIYDTSAVAGFHLFMLGTLVHWFSCKFPTPAQSKLNSLLEMRVVNLSNGIVFG